MREVFAAQVAASVQGQNAFQQKTQKQSKVGSFWIPLITGVVFIAAGLLFMI